MVFVGPTLGAVVFVFGAQLARPVTFQNRLEFQFIYFVLLGRVGVGCEHVGDQVFVGFGVFHSREVDLYLAAEAWDSLERILHYKLLILEVKLAHVWLLDLFVGRYLAESGRIEGYLVGPGQRHHTIFRYWVHRLKRQRYTTLQVVFFCALGHFESLYRGGGVCLEI